MSAVVKLSKRFQISIPKAVREHQRWHAGQELALISKDHGVLLVPVPELDQLAGIVKGAKTHSIRER